MMRFLMSRWNLMMLWIGIEWELIGVGYVQVWSIHVRDHAEFCQWVSNESKV